MTKLSLALVALLALPALSQAQGAPDDFLNALRAHCGKAYEGRLIDPQPVDSAIARERLVMHVRGCGDTVRVPFHVGANRSRTWVLTRTASGLRLKHDHRHEDGSEDRTTQYGGDSRAGGTATVMETVHTFVREGSDRRFRVEFDLTRPITPPPAPWGFERR